MFPHYLSFIIFISFYTKIFKIMPTKIFNMAKLKILNTKEIKNIKKIIKNHWGADTELDYAFLMNDKGKIFIINREIGEIDLSKLNINNIGLYFGELMFGELRLSIEGSQIIGTFTKKNIVNLNEKQTEEWMQGNDVSVESKNLNLNGFIIIKHDKDFLGSGKYKEGKILNYVPKERRAYIF